MVGRRGLLAFGSAILMVVSAAGGVSAKTVSIVGTAPRSSPGASSAVQASPSLVLPTPGRVSDRPDPAAYAPAALDSAAGRTTKVLGRAYLTSKASQPGGAPSAPGVPGGAPSAPGVPGSPSGLSPDVATFHLHGEVMNQAAVGISGIAVSIESAVRGGSSAGATTDGAGDYDVVLPAGTYRFALYDPSATYASGWWSATVGITADMTDGSTAKITNANVTQNMTIPPIPHITGLITNAADGTGTSVNFTLRRAFNDLSIVRGGFSALDGTFSVAADPGTYALEVPAGAGSYYSLSGLVMDASNSSPIVVTTAGDTTGIDVALPQLSSLSGSISYTGCTPSGSVEVDVYDQWSGFYKSTTGTNSYSLSVPPGAYEVGFFDPSGLCASGWFGQSGFVAGAGDAAPVEVTMGVPGTASVTLPTAKLITGKITVADFGPTADGFVVEAFTSADIYIETLTASNGTFALPVAPGTYTLFIAPPDSEWAGGWYHAGGTTYDSSAATPVVVGSSNVNLGITLGGDYDALGGVVKGPSGTPVYGVLVTAYVNGDVAGWGVSDANGRYQIAVFPGTFRLFESGSSTLLPGWYGPGGFTQSQAVATKVSGTAGLNLNFSIPAGHWITGTVTGAGVVGVHDTAVELFKSGSLYAVGFTGYGGEYGLLVSSGSYQVGYYEPTLTFGSGWYSSGGLVRDYGSADTLVLSTVDLTGKDVLLPLATKPDPPTGATAAGFDSGAIVRWQAPANDGWNDITGYTVTASPGGAQCVTGGDLFCSVTGLTNGSPYSFTVVATNAKGDSDPSGSAGPLMPTTVPAPPTTVGAVALDAAADVVWSASSAGGITGYTVTSTPGSHQCTTTGRLACRVTGLTNLTSYTFTVAATNGNGTGPDSGSSPAVTPVAGAKLLSHRLDNATFPDLTGFSNDRYGTDAAVVEGAFGTSASTVYIADGQNFPDALGAGAAAAQAGAPLLLVTPGSIPPAIAHELSVLQPTTIFVVGGTASVSAAVLNALTGYLRP